MGTFLAASRTPIQLDHPKEWRPRSLVLMSGFTEAECQLLHTRSGNVIQSNEVDLTIHTVDDCRYLYSLLQEDRLPINTLAIYAHQDSAHKYRVWHKQ
jgi:hypothetical protein